MTLSQAGLSHPRIVRSPVNGSIREPSGLARSRRSVSSRPACAPLCYRGTRVGMSTAPHRKRPVTLATTVGLALLAAGITLWLGLVARFGSMVNGGSAGASLRMPDRFAVVRVEPGESLQDVATRLARGEPPRQVVERIRELNALDSSLLAAGRTLIVPVG